MTYTLRERRLMPRPRFDVSATWNRVLKKTIGRFVRGNIAAQRERLLLPEEGKERHERARAIAEQWRERASK